MDMNRGESFRKTILNSQSFYIQVSEAIVLMLKLGQYLAKIPKVRKSRES